jgi:hypothetical protein
VECRSLGFAASWWGWRVRSDAAGSFHAITDEAATRAALFSAYI